MKRKTIILHLPHGYENTKVVKLIDIDENHSMQIEIVEDDAEHSIDNNNVFICFQERVQTVFNPLDYAYIESTSNHHSLWHPIDARKSVLDIYMKSLDEILTKLNDAGLTMFWRIHSSYIVNCRCITKFADGKVFLRNKRKPLPIGEVYVNVLKKIIVVI
ncbi:MAG: LytTR family transcriptional regulator DNA-binding domain-containing protein [Prevotella sp.]|nr:LytTR family transcriptional regulator DNA-binding domain-containing protein [Prevotella sp.]